jgi:S1-C subfamily serine protease
MSPRLAEDNETVYLAATCGGIAIGPHEILTADHCLDLGQTSVAVVDQTTWLTTIRGHVLARVVLRDPAKDLARLHTDEILDYTGLSAQTSGAAVVSTRFESRPVQHEGDRVQAEVSHTDSGSAVCDPDGKLIGVLVARDDRTLFGRLVRP